MTSIDSYSFRKHSTFQSDVRDGAISAQVTALFFYCLSLKGPASLAVLSVASHGFGLIFEVSFILSKVNAILNQEATSLVKPKTLVPLMTIALFVLSFLVYHTFLTIYQLPLHLAFIAFSSFDFRSHSLENSFHL